MPVKSSYEPLRDLHGTPDDLVRVQQAVKSALDELAAQIPSAPTVNTFVTTGRNGVGPVPLPPIKDGAGNIIVRARAGAQVISVIDPITPQNPVKSFARTLTKDDQIQQIDTANLSLVNLVIQVLA